MYQPLQKSFKKAYPFKLCTTSFIYPDHLLPNVKMLAIEQIRGLIDTDDMKAVTKERVDPLVDLVRTERDREVLDAYAGLLTALTGVPLSLPDEAQEREKFIRTWLQRLEEP